MFLCFLKGLYHFSPPSQPSKVKQKRNNFQKDWNTVDSISMCCTKWDPQSILEKFLAVFALILSELKNLNFAYNRMKFLQGEFWKNFKEKWLKINAAHWQMSASRFFFLLVIVFILTYGDLLNNYIPSWIYGISANWYRHRQRACKDTCLRRPRNSHNWS